MTKEFKFKRNPEWAREILNCFPENEAYKSFVEELESKDSSKIDSAMDKLKDYVEEDQLYILNPSLGEECKVGNAMIVYSMILSFMEENLGKDNSQYLYVFTSNTRFIELVNKYILDIRTISNENGEFSLMSNFLVSIYSLSFMKSGSGYLYNLFKVEEWINSHKSTNIISNGGFCDQEKSFSLTIPEYREVEIKTGEFLYVTRNSSNNYISIIGGKNGLFDNQIRHYLNKEGIFYCEYNDNKRKTSTRFELDEGKFSSDSKYIELLPGDPVTQVDCETGEEIASGVEGYDEEFLLNKVIVRIYDLSLGEE